MPRLGMGWAREEFFAATTGAASGIAGAASGIADTRRGRRQREGSHPRRFAQAGIPRRFRCAWTAERVTPSFSAMH